MTRRGLVAGLIAMLAAAHPALAPCADITGTISDLKGAPVAKVQITATEREGKSGAVALTDGAGKYLLGGLSPGTYRFALDPRGSGFRGGDAVAELSGEGLVVDWKVSPDASALALAHDPDGPGLAGDPFGFSADEFAALLIAGTTLVAGGVIGGYAAAGGFSGPSASPSE